MSLSAENRRCHPNRNSGQSATCEWYDSDVSGNFVFVQMTVIVRWRKLCVTVHPDDRRSIFIIHGYTVWQCRKSQPSCLLQSNCLQCNGIETKLADGYGGQVQYHRALTKFSARETHFIQSKKGLGHVLLLGEETNGQDVSEIELRT